MKTIKNLLSVFLILTSFSFISCAIEPIDESLSTDTNSGNGNSSGGNSPTYYVKAKIDGVQKQWVSYIANIININNEESLVITALDLSDNSTMILTIFDDNVLTTGAYPLDLVDVSCNYSLGNSDFSSNYSNGTASPGNIVVIERNTANKILKGTFNFVGKNNGMTQTKTFTAGEFNVVYQ
jgi:hypothetical protein